MYSTIKYLFRIDLRVHDDGGAAAASAGDGGAQGSGAESGASAIPPELAARVNKGAKNEPVVVYGKQDSPVAEDKQTQTPAQGTQEQTPKAADERTPEQKSNDFLTLIKGEYKDEFTKYFQTKFNDRFKGQKSMEKQLDSVNPLLDTLAERYGVNDRDPQKIAAAVDNDAAFIEQLADDAGLSVEQYKENRSLIRENERLRRENAQVAEMQQAQQNAQRWLSESESMASKYPNFSLETEIDSNPDFLNLLKAGSTVEGAYWATHFSELGAGVADAAGRRAEANVTKSIQTKGRRPVEAGAAVQPGVIVKDDPSQYTKADLMAVVEKAKHGEKIKF